MSQWYYAKNGQQQGPVSEEQLRQMLGSGELLGTDLVWRDGMNQWEPAGRVFPGVGAPAPVAPTMQPPGYGNAYPPPQAGFGQGPYGQISSEDSTQKTLAIVAIVLGCVGFICCPIVFGVGGIVCGAIAVNRPGPHKTLAKTGLIVAIAGTVLGMVVGALWFMANR